ncbi:hypothetical protein Q3G72_027391 [Acer saccharum]|nr:hypothetical protein Q3G72_027391 [Acer saccharum]
MRKIHSVNKTAALGYSERSKAHPQLPHFGIAVRKLNRTVSARLPLPSINRNLTNQRRQLKVGTVPAHPKRVILLKTASTSVPHPSTSKEDFRVWHKRLGKLGTKYLTGPCLYRYSLTLNGREKEESLSASEIGSAGTVWITCKLGGQSLQPVIESDQIDMILKTTNNLLARYSHKTKALDPWSFTLINKAAFPVNPFRRLPGVRRSLLAKERSPIAADLSFERLFLLFPATSESGQELIGIRAFSSIPRIKKETEANPSLLTNAPTPIAKLTASLSARAKLRPRLLVASGRLIPSPEIQVSTGKNLLIPRGRAGLEASYLSPISPPFLLLVDPMAARKGDLVLYSGDLFPTEARKLPSCPRSHSVNRKGKPTHPSAPLVDRCGFTKRLSTVHSR